MVIPPSWIGFLSGIWAPNGGTTIPFYPNGGTTSPSMGKQTMFWHVLTIVVTVKRCRLNDFKWAVTSNPHFTNIIWIHQLSSLFLHKLNWWILGIKGRSWTVLVFTSASNQVDTKVTAKGLYAVRRFFHLLFGCLNSYLVKSLLLDWSFHFQETCMPQYQ